MEKSCIHLYSFSQEDPHTQCGPLTNPDMVVIPDSSYKIHISFPLETEVVLVMQTNSPDITLRNVLATVKGVYEMIYEQEVMTTEQTEPIRMICPECEEQQIEWKELCEDAEDCAICYGEYTDDNPGGTTVCDHTFHRSCLSRWLEHQATCPICRTHLRDCELCGGRQVLNIIINDGHYVTGPQGGMFGIYHNFEDLFLVAMKYDRVAKKLSIKMAVHDDTA